MKKNIICTLIFVNVFEFIIHIKVFKENFHFLFRKTVNEVSFYYKQIKIGNSAITIASRDLAEDFYIPAMKVNIPVILH